MYSDPVGASVQSFYDLLEREKKARDMYKEYAEKVSDEYLKNLFLTISEQEQGHMEIANELIKLVQ